MSRVHALRHTGATLAYRYTHDLRAQDMLGYYVGDPVGRSDLEVGKPVSRDQRPGQDETPPGQGITHISSTKTPKTTARYARVVDRAKTNPSLKVPVDL